MVSAISPPVASVRKVAAFCTLSDAAGVYRKPTHAESAAAPSMLGQVFAGGYEAPGS